MGTWSLARAFMAEVALESARVRVRESHSVIAAELRSEFGSAANCTFLSAGLNSRIFQLNCCGEEALQAYPAYAGPLHQLTHALFHNLQNLLFTDTLDRN